MAFEVDLKKREWKNPNFLTPPRLLLPEGPIVQGAEKSVFVRCRSFVRSVSLLWCRHQSNLDIFQVFVDTIVERVRWCDTPTTFGSEIWPLHE